MEKIIFAGAIIVLAWVLLVRGLRKRVRRKLKLYRRDLENPRGNPRARSLVRKSRFYMWAFFISPHEVGYMNLCNVETQAHYSIQLAKARMEEDLRQVRLLIKHEEGENALRTLLDRERELLVAIRKLERDLQHFAAYK